MYCEVNEFSFLTCDNDLGHFKFNGRQIRESLH